MATSAREMSAKEIGKSVKSLLERINGGGDDAEDESFEEDEEVSVVFVSSCSVKEESWDEVESQRCLQGTMRRPVKPGR